MFSAIYKWGSVSHTNTQDYKTIHWKWQDLCIAIPAAHSPAKRGVNMCFAILLFIAMSQLDPFWLLTSGDIVEQQAISTCNASIPYQSSLPLSPANVPWKADGDGPKAGSLSSIWATLMASAWTKPGYHIWLGSQWIGSLSFSLAPSFCLHM